MDTTQTTQDETTTIYNYNGITVEETEDPGMNAEAFLGQPVSDPRGVVYFDVKGPDGILSSLAAPMFDVTLRSEAATEAIRQADAYAER